MIIGLTGQTGSGKSTVCTILEKQGYYICDCDKISKEVMADGASLLYVLAKAFGDDILDGDHLNRRLLADKAFREKDLTELLNSITHPAILKKCKEDMSKAFEEGYEHAVLDAPTLFESGADKLCDYIVSVSAPENVRLKRILLRDKIHIDQAKTRMGAQKDESFYIENSDFVIRNYPPFDLDEQVRELVEEIRNHKA
ncbi:MAG: dephospho-CoA kinase [Clostridia bacterium]|nr:dephospho-CoA kinase [Clostridia bacterium]